MPAESPFTSDIACLCDAAAAPTSAAVYEGLDAAFAHALTSLAGMDDGKSVMSAFECLCPIWEKAAFIFAHR